MKHYFFILFYLISNLIVYIFQGSLFLYIFSFFLFCTVIVWASFDITFNYFVDSLIRIKTNNQQVSLTFDDGPTEYTPKFLDLLKEKQIKATFFCIGKQIEKYPDIFKRIISEGHSVGNHTYSHSKKTGFLSAEKMIQEIKKCDKKMLEVANVRTKLYRPPFGVTNPNISKAIKITQKKSIAWTIRSLDTVIDNEKTILDRITKNLKKGSIILFHDTSDKTFNVLTKLIPLLESKNYSFFRI